MVFAIIAITILALIAPLMLSSADNYVAGKIRIGGIRAEVHTVNEAPCDCCPILWNGGIATTTADLSAIRLYDIADIVTLDGGHYVLECVEIIPCIQVGGCLVGWQGVIRTKGDIILYDAYKAYRFTRL